MVALIEAIVAIGVALYTINAILTPAGKKSVATFIGNLVGGAVSVAEPVLAEVEGQLQPIMQAFVAAVKQYGPGIADTVKEPFADLAKGTYTFASDELEKLGESTPDNAIAAAAEAMATAFGFGMSSAGVTAAFEAAFPEKLNTLNGVGPLLASMAGFREIESSIRRPLYDAAFGRSLQYHYRSKFKPELPKEADAVEWHSRRLLTDDQLRTLFNFSGLKAEYEKPFIEAAYRAPSPFLLAGSLGITTGDPKAVREAFKFYGMRDQDIDAMMQALRDRALAPQINASLTQEVDNYSKGWATAADLDDTIKLLDLVPEAARMVKLRAEKMRLRNLQDPFRKELVDAAKAGQISLQELHDRELAIGLDQAFVTQDVTTVTLALDVEARKEATREFNSEVRQARSAGLRAAMVNYRKGELDDIGFSLALVALGFPVEQVAEFLSLAQAMMKPTIETGRTLSQFAQQQADQKAEIRALIQQFKKGVIGEAELRSGLAANGYDQRQIDAEVAYLTA